MTDYNFKKQDAEEIEKMYNLIIYELGKVKDFSTLKALYFLITGNKDLMVMLNFIKRLLNMK